MNLSPKTTCLERPYFYDHWAGLSLLYYGNTRNIFLQPVTVYGTRILYALFLVQILKQVDRIFEAKVPTLPAGSKAMVSHGRKRTMTLLIDGKVKYGLLDFLGEKRRSFDDLIDVL